ncbi:D-alanyl-D-alanine carboxypeptidase family protein [Desulfosporosinus hippei]|uniref:D-alanyl-D-alanine carboxypeptidase (Penicillin-binding protein 5/6) n=1 Tax=Desulfosporosinus hippei DSM 8344 TaxID=1121419 RepID=A0A1G7ZXC8_9FIRM|nr:D-alanyl-D-alanine carboxypeptidase family protein [Desulfosporosinus hippei]SDH13303.1 D-alanyl-D-alanine carboxypeptidase (penicillin-binding protein 5/6) [Desulfosporosinus hippei DSM 8344]
MRLFRSVFLALFIIISSSPVAYAENTPPPDVRGEGAFLIDVSSGQTLFVKNPDKQLAPASTTKIMTGLLAIENGNFDDMVTVSKTMLNNKVVYGTQIYLEPGEQILFKDLLYATLLNSANDAAVTLAEYVGKDMSHFVEMMNQRASEIGATNTHFVNPSGLTETGHLTTAHDLALIAREAYQNPIFAEFVRTKTQPISRSKADVPVLMVNENKLLWRDSSVDGIKTGYTAAAQNCLVASATKEGRQLIGVILKSPGREIYTDMQNMFDYGFTQFSNTIIKPAGAVISSITVNTEPVDLVLDQPIYSTQKLNAPENTLNLRVTPLSTDPLTSVEEGQVLGQVAVLEGETQIDVFPLKAAKSVHPEPVKASLAGSVSSFSTWIIGTLLLSGTIFFLNSLYKKRRKTLYWRRQVRRSRRRDGL